MVLFPFVSFVDYSMVRTSITQLYSLYIYYFWKWKALILHSFFLQIYYYADAQTTHTIFPDGLEVLQFPNNQIGMWLVPM